MISPPASKWLSVVSYREFYDLPRLLLISDDTSSFWIFDCKFDERADEYPNEYRVFFAGRAADKALREFEEFAKSSADVAMRDCDRLPIGDVKFDATRKKKLMIQRV